MVLAVYLLFSVACFFTVHEHSRQGCHCRTERELREGLFDLFELDMDDEIAELAKKRRREYREITEQDKKREMENEGRMQRFE